MAAARAALRLARLERLSAASRRAIVTNQSSSALYNRSASTYQRDRREQPPLFEHKQHKMREAFEAAHAQSKREGSIRPIEEFAQEFIRENQDLFYAPTEAKLSLALQAIQPELEQRDFDAAIVKLKLNPQATDDDFSTVFETMANQLQESFSLKYEALIAKHADADNDVNDDIVHKEVAELDHPSVAMLKLYFELEAPIEDVTSMILESAFRTTIHDYETGMDAIQQLRERSWVSGNYIAEQLVEVLARDLEVCMEQVAGVDDATAKDAIVEQFIHRELRLLDGVTQQLGLGVNGRMTQAVLAFALLHSDALGLSMRLLKGFYQNKLPVHADAMHALLAENSDDAVVADAIIEDTIQPYLTAELIALDEQVELAVLYTDMMAKHSNLQKATSYFTQARRIMGTLEQAQVVEPLELYVQTIKLLGNQQPPHKLRHLAQNSGHKSMERFIDAFIQLGRDTGRAPLQFASTAVAACVKSNSFAQLNGVLATTSTIAGGFVVHDKIVKEVLRRCEDETLRSEFEQVVAANRARRERADQQRARRQEARSTASTA